MTGSHQIFFQIVLSECSKYWDKSALLSLTTGPSCMTQVQQKKHFQTPINSLFIQIIYTDLTDKYLLIGVQLLEN